MNRTPSQPNDSFILNLVLAGIFCCVVYFIWDSYRADIVYHVLLACWYLLGVFDWSFSPDFIKEWRNEMAYAAPHSANISFSGLLTHANRTGYFFVPLSILLTLCCLKYTLQHPSLRTRRAITADALRIIMAEHAFSIIPVLHYGDLLKNDPPSQRRAMTPEEYASHHGLIQNSRLNIQRTAAVLEHELGPRLTRLEDMTLHEQYMLSVFCIRLFEEERPFEKSIALLDELNRSCYYGTWNNEAGYPDFSRVTNPFLHYCGKEELQSLFRIHPYSRTLLYTLHQEALKQGKLPSSYFRWLKGMDRPLWYALNTTGRKAPFAESSAVFTQARWETSAWEQGYLLQEPCLNDAINALENHLQHAGLIIDDMRKTA